jgi:hypothetical protein
MQIKKQLDAELKRLKKNGTDVMLQVRMSRDQESKHFVSAYLWWRKASTVKGYLNNLYDEAGITHKNIKNKINFRPMLRLLSEGDIDTNELLIWTKVLNKVHEKYQSKPKAYVTGAANQLALFIKNNGGKTGLAGYHNKQNDDADYEEIDSDASDAAEIKNLVFELNESEFTPMLAKEARNYYGAHNNLQGVELPALNLTEQGYSIIVVKSDGTTTELVGTIADQSIVDSTLIRTYRNEFDAMPLTMRCVVEPLHLLNVPNVIAKSIDKFIENSKVEDTIDGEKKERAYKRLVYRADTGEFMLSQMYMPAGVVLTAKPNQAMFNANAGDMFINNEVRLSIEVRLLHQNMFNLFTTNSPHKYKALHKGFGHAYTAQLDTKLHIDDDGAATAKLVKHYTTNLKHPSIAWTPFYKFTIKPRWQTAANVDSFKADWQGTIDIDWLRSTSVAFFDNWIAAYANKANRPVNKILNLTFSTNGMGIGYEFGDKGYDIEKQYAIDKSKGKASLQVRSADFAFFVRQLADLNVQGNIDCKANEHGVKFEFATAANTYMCFVPACNAKGVRDKTYCTVYNPTTTDHAYDLDNDDKTPEITADEEMHLLLKMESLRK